MRSNETKCLKFLKSNKLPVAVCNTDGHLIEANEAFCLLTGYGAEEIRNGEVNWRMLTFPELMDHDCHFLEEVQATGFCRPYEEVFQKRDGRPVPAITGGARLENPSDQVIAFALDISSIPQGNEMIARIQERMFLLSQVISDFQDEFVLRVKAEESMLIRLQELQTLSEQYSPARQRLREQMIQLLHDGLEHMLLGCSFGNSLMERRRDVRHETAATTDIIGKALETSRSLTTELSLSILHEGKVVTTIRRLAGSMRDRYGLEVTLALDEAIESAVDEVKLLVLQAVRELLMNVIQHSDVNLARVTASVRGYSIQLDIEDDGIGFDPGQQESVKGSPGGLDILRDRIRNSGGQMQLFSAPGLGTRCSIALPYGMETVRQRAAGAGRQRIEDKRIHILLVDDHTVIRQSIVGLLRRESDLEVVGEAPDGESAIELARAVEPDVILMDVYMPGMGGVQATRVIHSELPRVRVIGLSMLEEREMALLMHEAGAVGYLTKNGPSNALISAIRACV